MKTNDGGPAFPISEWHLKSANGRVTHPDWRGMTLRDYFAAKAMQGMMANPNVITKDKFHADNFAAAYEAADAMLRAREKANEGQ